MLMKLSISSLIKFSFVGICVLCNTGCTNNEVSEVDVMPSPQEAASSEVTSNEIIPVKVIPAKVKSPLAILNDLIGLNCELDKQCRVAGIGHSPCGGYARYVVYSETDSQVKLLGSKIDSYNEQQKQKNIKEKLVGICRHIPAPAAVCSGNRCVAITVERNSPNSEIN